VSGGRLERAWLAGLAEARDSGGVAMASTARPVVVSFCTQFISARRLHVYRQVCGVRSFENWVVTRRRYNAGRFPYERLYVLRKSPYRWLLRLLRRDGPSRLRALDRFETEQLRRFVRERGAVLVHAYFGTEAARLTEYFAGEPRARVVSFHGADVTEHALSDRELAGLCATVDLFLCRSRSLVDRLVHRGCAAERVRLNRTGVPLPAVAPVRTPPGLSATRPVRLLQACRFVPKKGIDVSIRSLAVLGERGVAATLTLAGDGPERDGAVALARDLGVASRVRFTGFLDVDTLGQAMLDHDVFLQPSRPTATGDLEGIPNAMLEAMAVGLPVVATEHSGIPEAIAHGRDGWLIPEAHPGALAEAVVRVVGDADRYGTLSAGARARVAAEFSIEACVAGLEESYREAIGLRGAAPAGGPAAPWARTGAG
jgi:glycosyltransferase involved in cell wall biosynthesis